MPSSSESNIQASLGTIRGRVLLALMWKHYRVRRRRFIITTLEFISPVIFFFILFIFKGTFIHMSPQRIDGATNKTLDEMIPEIDISLLPKPSVILYQPHNNLTSRLMTKVGESLGLNRLYFYSDYTPGYFGSNDNQFIQKCFKKFGQRTHAFVAFKNMDEGKLPDHLQYTIRMNANFQTHISNNKKKQDEMGPNREYVVEYAEFVRLQWAIDSSFLELRSGQPIKQSVSIQEFPYTLSTAKRSTLATVVVMMLVFLSLFISLILPFEFLVSRLMGERASGIQELIQMVGVTTRTLGLSHFLNVLPGGIIFSVLGAALLTSGDLPILEYSSGFLIGLFLFLHFVSIVALAFACSFITNNTEHTISLATLLYFGFMIPAFIMSTRTVPEELVPISGIVPYVPAVWFYKEATSLEIDGEGVTLKTVMSSNSKQSCSMFWVYMFLSLQSLAFFALAWYLSLVRPRKHGAALPWDFFCRKEYWSNNKVCPGLEIEMRQFQKREDKYFEPHPPNSEVGIDIQKVNKIFDGFVALNNVSLPVLKEEITVLLGHNGAGKTTLMSIVTGTLAATSGKVYVNGLDTVTQQTAVRTQLGFCPQHNLFFNELTVLEHIKGSIKWEQSKQSSLDLLKELGLEEKANSLSGQLSGGMKRRLQLACALAGDANVLVLDEPTAGLDVETRRSLWDLLLSLRAGRTVLLSTHFMEEADALGDRIAALHCGTLRCDASPMHLKKEIETGYNLSIILKADTAQSATDDISKIITSVLPQATQLSVSGIRTLSFKLPSRECDKFPALFKKLEESRDKVGIDSMSVGVSTLEEVFLKLCSDVSVTEDDVVATLRDDRTSPKHSGVKLMKYQFVALLIRQIRYIKASWQLFGMMQVVLPIVMIFAITFATRGGNHSTQDNPAAVMNFETMFKDRSRSHALSSFDTPLRSRPACCGLNYTQTDDIPQTLLNISKRNEFEYYTYLIGVKLNDTKAVAHFTTSVRHAMPVSVNALTNAIASTLPADGPDNALKITTVNHPLQEASKNNAIPAKTTEVTAIWTVIITFVIQSTLINVLVLPGKERFSSVRHIHLMTGCSPELYWLTPLLFHTAYSIIALILPTMMFAVIIDNDKTISQTDLMLPLALLLLGGCLSSIALAFLVSFMLPYKHAASSLVAFYFVFTFLVPAVKMSCDTVRKEKLECKVAGLLIRIVLYTVTPNTFLEAMMKIAKVARMNAYCKLNKHLCPNLVMDEPISIKDSVKCCVLNQPPRCYLCFDKHSPLPYIIALYSQFVILMVLVILTERGIFYSLHDRLLNYRYRAEEVPRDKVLQEEHLYVMDSLKKSHGDAMLVSSVHKRYPAICQKSTSAVKGISFSVREGECFGLVGVNGAGKSTTFKMMTCATVPTRGEIVANDQNQHIFDNSKYLNELGYCPQFFGMDDFLTGRQNMELLLTLDGLNKEDAKMEAARWLELIDLMKYADRKVSAYSGGCSRRLSSVAALARRAALSLLDEPTAGVDVAARRQLWRAVRAAQAQTTLAGRKRAVLITSHSMDEMEALCSRVGIMSAGLLVALGSPAALRAAHQAGLALFIKIKDASANGITIGTDASTVESSELQKLKQACRNNQWKLKDEHKTLLSYHVDRALKMEYSELFTKLEELRRTFPNLIEDYAVTATTLEEVFLTYAKPSAEDQKI